MAYLLNGLYLLLVAVLSPWLAFQAATKGKYRRGMIRKFFGRVDHPELAIADGRPVVWFHGVSVGEIHLLRQLVPAWRKRHPEWRVVVSTTTDTGFDEAQKIFPDLAVVYWPLDFSWAVGRALDTIRPNLVVLAESELWPNFLAAARRREVPVAVVNGRMSPRSAARFSRFRFFTRRLFDSVTLFVAQTDAYAEAYRRAGAGRVVVSGSIKYDGASFDRQNSRTQELRRLFDLDEALVWTAGSTQAPEEEICIEIFRRAREQRPELRLVLVPRQKDRFDEVASLLDRSGIPYARRSTTTAPVGFPIVLVDTIGELGAIWGLTDVAFVGGSLDGKRGGQNMIEPAAMGAAVVFGPHTWNFAETVARLLRAEAAIEVADAAELERTVNELFDDARRRQGLGARARDFVRAQAGSTDRTLTALDTLLPSLERRAAA